MRRIICICFIFSLSLSGCSHSDMRLYQLNQTTETESEAMKYVEDTVIQALETKDAELLKSIFSEQALDRANDIELGIEYMFDIYEGDFIKISNANYSTDEHIEKKNSWICIYGQCHIETSQKEYVMSWSDWIKHTGNPSAVGVYMLEMAEYKEGEYYSYFDIAGVNYPERDLVHNTLHDFIDMTDNSSPVDINSFLSLNASKNIDDTEKEKLLCFLSRLRLSNMKGVWIEYKEIGGKIRTNVYLEITTPHILYFTYDLEEPDKISAIKLTKIEEGKTEKDFVLEMDGYGAKGFTEFYDECCTANTREEE